MADNNLHNVDEKLFPPQMRVLVQLIGLPETINLLKAYGGQRVWIPLGKSERTELHKVISHDAILKLAKSHMAGLRITLPKVDKILEQLRNEHIRTSPNVPKSQMAKQYNLTIRHIQRIKNELDENPTLDMFD